VTTPKHLTPCPKHLTAAARRIWRQIVADYQLEERHLGLLRLALEALDSADEARHRIEADGSYIADRYGCLKVHPAIAVQRDARIAFARLSRELGLDLEAPTAPTRPPSRWHG
jgi:P27 family predicted phage terminase small subunit